MWQRMKYVIHKHTSANPKQKGKKQIKTNKKKQKPKGNF